MSGGISIASLVGVMEAVLVGEVVRMRVVVGVTVRDTGCPRQQYQLASKDILLRNSRARPRTSTPDTPNLKPTKCAQFSTRKTITATPAQNQRQQQQHYPFA